MILKGRVISKGYVEAELLVSKKPFSFLGGVDKEGNVIDKESDIYGESLKGKIFAFPYGKGSTVGSYVIYDLAKRGILKGIINKECEPIVATGAILGGIPLIDRIDIDKLESGKRIVLDAYKGLVKL
ncbi:DUF126 domain-containing protein [Methanocaldococcus infernus]|uniref:Phosphomevalonate dehydratase small subunit n=1 Tax=Methanocaldococcus infernus (strain DSM 11812 / JCM 15783 / ME) TaxID=573063 RepID=D5VQM1_METIM|nr:DUF126 domain-containing protein [Methanocaldococcus infernus]ADG12874.1 protein of unknown function DUF126 [Methanocaldococcus infernus ME]